LNKNLQPKLPPVFESIIRHDRANPVHQKVVRLDEYKDWSARRRLLSRSAARLLGVLPEGPKHA